MSFRALLILSSLCTLLLLRPTNGDLVGYWNFDGNVADQSTFGNDGELIDAVYDDNVPAAIGSGQSISFEVDTDHVFIENGNGDLDSEEFTLSMFIFDRGQEGALERLTSREGDTFETAINVHPPFAGESEYAFYSSAGGGWQWGEDSPPLEEWQHVAYVADADEQTMIIYVDGELVWETADPWFTTPTGFMHIGNRHNDVEGFDGLIDDVAIWDEVLDEASIKTIATSGVAAFLNPAGGGDLNADGLVNVADIDALAAAIQAGDMGAKFDLNGDGSVNSLDIDQLVITELGTWFGDADVNGEFNSGDFVIVFQAGEYEDLLPGNSTWAEGDFNGDGEFNSTDLVKAFQDGGFELGPRPGVASVPEPESAVLFGFALVCLVSRLRTKSNS